METIEKNTRTRQENQENEMEIIWERCCELYLRAENGNNESLKELEEICQNNQNDAVCLGYYWRVMGKIDYDKYQDKINQTKQKISEIISTLKSNSSSFDDFIQNLSNKHQQYVFGWLYEIGIGVEENSEECFRLMKLSSDQGHVIAEYQLGRRFAYGNGVEKNRELGFQYYVRTATQGYSAAQYRVGECYEKGFGVSTDLSLAFEWFKKSAENGYQQACFKVGRCYFVGRGTEVNEEEGMRWLQLSAEKEYSDGLLKMGLFYHYGRIVERDRNKSIQLFEKLASQGDDDAKSQLGLHFLQDERDPANQTKGFQLLNEIYELEEKENVAIGLCHEFGLGTEKNQWKAYRIYLDESREGFPPATYNLGRCYEDMIEETVNDDNEEDSGEDEDNEDEEDNDDLEEEDDEDEEDESDEEEGIETEVSVDKARRWYERAAKGNDWYEGDLDAKNKLREFEEDKLNFKFTFRNKRKCHY